PRTRTRTGSRAFGKRARCSFRISARTALRSAETTTSAAESANLMTGVTPIGHVTLRQLSAREPWDRSVHSPAAQLHRAAIPRGRKRHLEIDGFGIGGLVNWGDGAVDRAIGPAILGGCIP